MQQFCDSLSPSLLSNSLSILQIIFVSTAVINASIVYAIVATKNIRFPITNVAIKNAANIIAATKNGHLKIFCSAIDIIITAIGKAKNISKVFIVFSPFLFYYILCFYVIYCYLNYSGLLSIKYGYPPFTLLSCVYALPNISVNFFISSVFLGSAPKFEVPCPIPNSAPQESNQ